MLILSSLLTPVLAQGSTPSQDLNPTHESDGEAELYLSVVINGFPPSPSIFGVEAENLDQELLLSKAFDAQAYLVRNFAFAWDEIEPVRTDPPTYHWEMVDETALQVAAARGLSVMAIVKYTPSWAQKKPGVACGPIAEDSLDEFAQFMNELVWRYSHPPYNIKYWEIGNEPDVASEYLDPHSKFGCWGDSSDEFYGGGYYAEMLKHVYPAVKAVDPSSKIINGGLLLDCDPTNPPANKTCLPAKFFEGILRNDGGENLDIVAFHAHVPWNGSLEMDEHHPEWEARGGVVLGKADFLREVMAEYDVDLPVMHNEGGLWGGQWNNPPRGLFEDQADYVIWLFVRNWAADLAGTIWYTIDGPGWRNMGLLDNNQKPKPVYQAYQFMTKTLGRAKYQRLVEDYESLRGYEFHTARDRIWVLWAPDQLDYTINLPENIRGVYDKLGNQITPTNNQITVNSPVYLILPPK